MRMDGTIDHTSEPHPDFGKVMANAIQNGFSPKRDRWVVSGGATVTHFAPKQRPITIPPDVKVLARPAIVMLRPVLKIRPKLHLVISKPRIR